MKLNRWQTPENIYGDAFFIIILIIVFGTIGLKKWHSFLKMKESMHVSGADEIVIARTFEEQQRLRSLPPIDAHYPDIVKDNTHVYNITVHESIPGADPATFEIINGSYAKDKNHYYGYDDGDTYTPIEGVNVSSFKVLNDYYAEDNSHVYFRRQMLYGADPLTFKPLREQDDDVAIDATHVFVLGVMIPNLNPKSVSVISSNYVKDSNNVYYGYSEGYWELIKNADPNTFEPIDEYRSKDAKHLFLYEKEVSSVDWKNPMDSYHDQSR
jgi:hypothetical protein